MQDILSRAKHEVNASSKLKLQAIGYSLTTMIESCKKFML